MSKSIKRRQCPATQRVIRAAECGENRISRYNCPPDCPFNPFSPAQYETLQKIESRVIEKAVAWLAATSPNRAQTLAQLDRTASQSDLKYFACQTAALYFDRDAQGRSCAEHWAAAGFPTLNNDERVIQTAIMQMRIRLVEVHRVLDDHRIEMVDLLDTTPTEFLVCDRSLAAEACRFTTLLAWFYPLPHFWRILAVAFPVSTLGPHEPLKVVEELVRHLGGPTARDTWNEWFAHNILNFVDALHAVALARRAQMFANIDAEFGKANYELLAPFETCRQTLDAIASVEPDELSDDERREGFAKARVWFDAPDKALVSAEKMRPVLGRVLLGQTHWRIEAMGGERFARLKTQFDQAMGDKVHFQGESRDNLAARFTSQQPQYDPALVPPNLLKQPDKLLFATNRVEIAGRSPEEIDSDFMAQQDLAWLDQPLPVLQGKTPRQAAVDPPLRPKLIRILKDRVQSCDQRNLESGGSYNMNWLLKELGAHEIIFDPPPRRPRPEQPDDELQDAPDDSLDELEPWPPLPDRPFTLEEAVERLSLGASLLNDSTEAMGTLRAAGGFIVDEIHDTIGNLLSEPQHALLTAFLAQVWFAFVPPGCHGPTIELEDLQVAFQKQLAGLNAASRGGDAAAAHFMLEEGPQPAMVKTVAPLVFRTWQEVFPPNENERGKSLVVVAMLKTFIELLDAKCRGAN
ncbi:MAG: hypothetical protein QHJ82_16110 [Verrucomicrobiota bacterium]|nr:hypothetical protein [Verrucomicrobiota bacterium]